MTEDEIRREIERAMADAKPAFDQPANLCKK